MFFPTWLTMILMLTAFMWTINQERMLSLESVSSIRMVFLVIAIPVMFCIILYNTVNAWLSTAFFAIGVISVGIAYQFYRMMPSRLPEEPKL
jgi:hypothetical protein